MTINLSFAFGYVKIIAGKGIEADGKRDSQCFYEWMALYKALNIIVLTSMLVNTSSTMG